MHSTDQVRFQPAACTQPAPSLWRGTSPEMCQAVQPQGPASWAGRGVGGACLCWAFPCLADRSEGVCTLPAPPNGKSLEVRVHIERIMVLSQT